MRVLISFLLLLVLTLSCKPSHSSEKIESIKNRGAEISKSTGKELAGTLMEKMKSGGLVEAVEFCNTAALPITQDKSESYGVLIKRTSLKTRNPKNAPSDKEAEVLKKYEGQLSKGVPLEAIVDINGENSQYFSPIIIEKKCLICHGTTGRELSKSADSIIKSHYPNDLATGYKEGDLRGIWSIAFTE